MEEEKAGGPRGEVAWAAASNQEGRDGSQTGDGEAKP